MTLDGNRLITTCVTVDRVLNPNGIDTFLGLHILLHFFYINSFSRRKQLQGYLE